MAFVRKTLLKLRSPRSSLSKILKFRLRQWTKKRQKTQLWMSSQTSALSLIASRGNLLTSQSWYPRRMKILLMTKRSCLKSRKKQSRWKSPRQIPNRRSQRILRSQKLKRLNRWKRNQILKSQRKISTKIYPTLRTKSRPSSQMTPLN